MTIGILADHYGRKLMLLMCLYIPVVRRREVTLSDICLCQPFAAVWFFGGVHYHLLTVHHPSLACGILE
jgi:hypothetical protein